MAREPFRDVSLTDFPIVFIPTVFSGGDKERMTLTMMFRQYKNAKMYHSFCTGKDMPETMDRIVRSHIKSRGYAKYISTIAASFN